MSIKLAVSGKGGVGKTTIAGTLARLFARDGSKVIAIDADPAMNLASALGTKNPTPLSKLREIISERVGSGPVYKMNPKVDDIIEKYSARAPDGVQLIVMGTIERGGEGCVCPEAAFLRAVLGSVVFGEDIMVMDMEAGIEHLGRGVTRNIDLMLVVVEPGMRSVETAARIKQLCGDIGIRNVASVINKVSNGKKEIEKSLKELALPVLGRIPYDEMLIKADLEGKAPLDAGGRAISEIKKVKSEISRVLKK
jgi:CO dehydrogenase maturation factor